MRGVKPNWRPSFRTRRAVFLGGAGIAFGGLVARLAELQLVRGQEFDQLAESSRVRLDPAPPPRGVIYDRNGVILATNKRNFYLTLTPEQVGGPERIADTLDRLRELLPDDQAEGGSRITEARRRRVLEEASRQARFVEIEVVGDLTWEEFARLSARAPELTGVSAKVGELRAYPYGAAFAHTIGYVQRANDRDIRRMIEAELKAGGLDPEAPAGKDRASAVRRLYKHPQMRLGKQGIEAYAEQTLKGAPGKAPMLVTASGRVIDELPVENPPKPGRDIVLSIDAALQARAIEAFGQEHSGSVVVMDVHSGEIIVMVSTPAFDPNEFVSGISTEKYDQYLKDEMLPLYHKSYDGTYPPGSTFKVVVAAAVLEAKTMKPEERVYCSGRVWYVNRFFHCWRREGHGSMNLHTALQHSCDCYFYEAARRTGIEAIAEMAKRFGLGHRYELGITGGKAGIVPNDAWKRKAVGEQWYEGETLSVGIGQGYMQASPLQLAVMTARVAAGEAARAPKLILSGVEVGDPDVRPLGSLSEDTMTRLRAGMFAVTSEAGGTAVRAGELDPEGKLPPPFTNARMAGKSGTAQVRVITAAERVTGVLRNDQLERRLRDHALFVAYAPADAPRYAGAVIVEHGDSGSRVAAPILRDVLAETLRRDPGARPAFKPGEPGPSARLPGETI
jgi:penicillin-binding protein 2